MIKNIIFDFGGVIIDIDPQSVATELAGMGYENIIGLHQFLLKENAYVRIETGDLSPEGFREMIRNFLEKPITDEQIDLAWNAIIKDIPPERIHLLETLRPNYRLFLLSNSNPIHYEHYNRYIKSHFGYPGLDSLFERAYYSFRLGMYKPDPEIFRFVLNDSRLVPGETLFIDDNRKNAEAATAMGILGWHLDDSKDVTDLFTGGKFNY